MPAALTLILICPSPGSRSGTPAHFSTSGGPYPVITTALGIVVPSFLVAASGWPRTVTSAYSLCASEAILFTWLHLSGYLLSRAGQSRFGRRIQVWRKRVTGEVLR